MIRAGKILKLLSVLLVAAFVLPGGCIRSNDTSSDKQVAVYISDFGAAPDDGIDDTPAVVAALDQIRESGKKTVLYFSEGTYDLFSKTASKTNYPVTAVHKQWDFITPFHLNQIHNLTIDGKGARLMMHGRMTPFVLNACTNIKIIRLSVEHKRPSVFELKVSSLENNIAEYEIQAGDQFILENDQLVWLDGENKKQVPNVCQYYDPGKDITRRCSDPLDNAISLNKISGNRIQARYGAKATISRHLQPGRLFQFRYGTRDQSGVVVYECQNISFEHLNIHSWNGLGFVCQFSRDLSFKNLRMEPHPASKRSNAGFADGIQIFACQGEIIIENNRIVGLQDDHINIYGQMMKVSNVEKDNELEAVFTSNETEGFLNFLKGDRLLLRNPVSLAAEGEYMVVDSELSDDKTMRITLDGSISEKHKDYWIENLTRIPDSVSIRGNYFGRVPTRSILMFVARRAIIENNTFHRIPMTTILMQCPDHRWALQNHVEKLIVRNNIFYECESALIRSNPQTKKLANVHGLYGSLEVYDNLVIMKERKPPFVYVRGFQEVNLGSNRMELSDNHPKMAEFHDCKEVHLAPQMTLGFEDTPNVGLKNVSSFSGESWTLLN